MKTLTAINTAATLDCSKPKALKKYTEIDSLMPKPPKTNTGTHDASWRIQVINATIPKSAANEKVRNLAYPHKTVIDIYIREIPMDVPSNFMIREEFCSESDPNNSNS